MWFEARGGGTDHPMIWVHAGPAGVHPMGFHVAQEVWDYVTEHGLDLRYSRRFVQEQLHAVRALLDSPPVRATVTAAQSAEGSSLGRLAPLGWALSATALGAAGVALAVRRRARTEGGDREIGSDGDAPHHSRSQRSAG